MSNSDVVGSPIDRSKRSRIETDELNSDYEQEEHNDRHPKRQAIPDPETKAPYFNVRQEQQPIEGSISIRSLVNVKDAGIIIGKGGKNVNEIRELSTARVTVSESVQGSYERILTVYGPLHAISRAFGLIGDKLLYDNASDTNANERTTASIKLLIPDNRMGILIGKNGKVIKSMQEQSTARLTASEEPLPMSSERVMTVQGTPTSIEQAVYLIANTLLARFGKQVPPVIPYKPIPVMENNMNNNNNNNGSDNRQIFTNTSPPTMMMGYNGMMPVGAIPVNMGQLYYPNSSVMYGGMMNPRQRDYGASNLPVSQTQQIYIPNEMVGSIIGKGGSKINEIRQRSGSQIKIDNPQSETSERLITITGSPERNQIALYLLYSRLESEKNRLGIR